MSRLENISEEFRKKEIARNIYDNNDQYSGTHPNALSDGDEKGKGETKTIGGKTDIEQRNVQTAKNKYNKNKPYDLSTA